MIECCICHKSIEDEDFQKHIEEKQNTNVFGIQPSYEYSPKYYLDRNKNRYIFCSAYCSTDWYEKEKSKEGNNS
jgi:hypothetical protein